MRSSLLNGGRRSKGFTLIELLTVIAIIGILAGIMIPVVGTVRNQARASQCVSNLRQCGAALLLHANDNKGVINFKAGGSGGANNIWSAYVATYAVNKVLSTASNQGLDILYCPSAIPYRHDPTNVNWQWDTYGGFFADTKSAGIKRLAVTEGGSTWTSHRVTINLLASPSRFPILMDSVRPNDARQRMNITTYTVTDSGVGVHLRHRNRANTVFYDGHVQAVDAAFLKDLSFVNAVDEKVNIISL